MKEIGVPIVKKRILGNGWQVGYYEEFEAVLFAGENIHQSVAGIIEFTQNKKYHSGFRREVVIAGYPFLVAVRPEEKGLYIGTRRLSRELALLKLHEVNPILVDREIEKQFFKLKDHMEKISTLSPVNFPSEIEWVTAQYSLPELWVDSEWAKVNEETNAIAKKLVGKVNDYRSSLFEKVSDYGLTLTAQFDLIRVHLLKFLALLPSLDHDKTGKEVKRNLLESLRRLRQDSKEIAAKNKRGVRPFPWYLSFLFTSALKLASFVPAGLLAEVVRYLVRLMARRFIAGESINTSHHTIRKLRLSGRDATLDQLGELVVSGREADEYFEKVLQLIHGMKQHIPKGERNKAGILAAHVSIKVSALSHDFRPEAFEATYQKVAPRLKRILLEALREEVFINVDAEHYHFRDLVLAIYSKVLLETPELKHFADTGIVVQAYLRDGAKHLMDVVELARKRNLRMPIRLVKGAYWDAETIEGEAHQFSPPQFLNKEESDIHFRQLACLALHHHNEIQLAVGSHNIHDHAFVESVRKYRYPSAPVIEHQCLHMTYEALSNGLAKMGWPTRNYMPIGNLLVGMAYLVRRIMENSSQVGVLSIMRSHKKALFTSPTVTLETKRRAGTLHHDSFITQLKSDFSPVRPLRLYLEEERLQFEKDIKDLETDLLARQEEFKNSADTKVVCSSRPELIIGTYKASTTSDVVRVVEETEKYLSTSSWAKNSMGLFRVAVLLKAADDMLLKRGELSALMMYEAGKTRKEALADVDEAIDFINYYARQEIALQIASQKYTNRGVIGVIAPWNFPLAIPCGMTVAPLLAGNGVILKPAEQTPLIGARLVDLLHQAGVPKNILHLIQGDGEVVGAPLVTHERVAGIVFTGSKGVGQWIYKHAGAQTIQHYHHQIPMQKKVITEMGGKNAIIVTNNCELDETISGILYSAFGHAGQKCSATSRVIVHREVKDALVARLIEAIKDLKVGDAMDPATSINPLITEADQQRVRKAVLEARDEVIRNQGKILIDRSFEKTAGFSVGPTLFELDPRIARKKESWARREVFGPVIHLMEYDSIIEAVELFNSTEYALTGGIYSQSQDDIDFLLRFLRAGNIYVNRPNTGARVAIEPFGGFKLSGTGPKAGGSGYLEQFHFLLSPQDSHPVKSSWAQDSGYALMTPRPSLISIAGRITRFETFALSFLEQYELFMGMVNESDKAQLMSFVTWVKDNLDHYVSGKHLNFVIPGQLSYNDKYLVKEAGLFVVVSPRPSIKSIHYLFGALALGSGVSVAAITDESYKVWKGILDLAWKAGFSKTNIDCSFMSPASLANVFLAPHYSFVYAGHFADFAQSVYKGVLDGEALNENMRSILSEIDGVQVKDPTHVLDQFVWTRSLAINTMRHGAPLELHT